MLVELLERIAVVAPDRPALVVVDGFDGAGKTVLSHELVELARTVGKRRAINVSIDGFYHPRAYPRRRAVGTVPESFYRASYDYQAFRRHVVMSLRAGRPIVPAVWDVDVRTCRPIPDVLVLVGGILLTPAPAASVLGCFRAS